MPQIGQGELLSTIVFVVVVIGSFYVFLFLPQQLARRRQDRLTRGLSVGDEVVTVGGLIGWVRRIEPGEITLDLGRDVYVRVVASGISHQRRSARRPEPARDPEDGAEKSRKRSRRK